MHAPEIITTEDGSHSLRIADLNENYHSTYGAIAESMHVFIDAGFKEKAKTSQGRMKILEIGFGTGLNALLTLVEAKQMGLNTDYTALEAFPLEADIWSKLNYPDLLNEPRAGEWFELIHRSKWNENQEIGPGFTLSKIHCYLQDYQTHGSKYDLIYFDAFGPDVQPEMWTEEIFRKISDMTNPEGILVTYSAKGIVRRAIQHVGFELERIPGPKGKREMIRAVRNERD